MAAANFARALSVTLRHEGGWADHPADPGGATMKGVTLATFRRYVPGASKSDLRAISNTLLQRIYRDGYWSVVEGDRLPSGVDLAVFDAGVNSGPSRGARWLQATVGASQDGEVGNLTLAATRVKNPVTVVKGVCDRRLGFVQSLSTWSVFGKGWGRRIGEIKATGMAWAGASANDIRDDADVTDKQAANDSKAGKGTGAAGAGAGGAPIAADFDWASLIAFGVVAAVLVGIAIVLIARSRRRKEAAAEQRRIAAKLEAGEV